MRAGLLTPGRVVALTAVAAVAVAGSPGAASPTAERGPLVRVNNQDPGLCHNESEPAVAVTRDGTWVAFNDIGDCLPGFLPVPRDLRVTTVQLLRPGRAPQQFRLPRLSGGDFFGGDPGLAVDVDGRSVLLSSLVARAVPHVTSGSVGTGSSTLAVVRLRPDGTSSLLPSPSGTGGADDKELIAVDRGAGSPFRGRVYLVWDEVDKGQVTFRAFDGRSWAPPVQIHDRSGGHPDVAVAPDGQVTVVFEDHAGVAARTSGDGGRSFGPAVRVLEGGDPGRLDPGCPLINVVGLRQRVIIGPRAAYDRRGRLHVTAALGAGRFTPGTPGASTARIRYVVRDGGRLVERPVPDSGDREQFAGALAVLPDGSAVVSHLEVDEQGSSMTAWAITFSEGGRPLSRTQLSDAPSPLPSASETASYALCYGLGDYTSLTPHGRQVTAAWGSAEGVARPAGDTDVLLRTLRLP